MPHPRDRLNLYCCSLDIEKTISENAFQRLLSIWTTRGAINEKHASDDNSIIEGGMQRVWLDAPGKTALYANNQGGFRVKCPICNAPAAKSFSTAITRWRKNLGPRSATCHNCGTHQPLETFDCNPPIRFAKSAIVFSGVNHFELQEKTRSEIRQEIGPFSVVLSRKA